MAVTKKHPAAVIAAAAEAGIRDVGENYAQELRDKLGELAAGALAAALRWHYIGRLQRNKIKYVVGKVALIHAVDSLDIARAIAERAVRDDAVQRVLVAVNSGGEAQKSGITPASAGEFLAALDSLDGIEVAGFMTMPPLASRPEDNREHFSALARLRDQLRRPDRPLPELSMGTTGDFEVAVEQGATLVRVGTAIFGPRPV